MSQHGTPMSMVPKSANFERNFVGKSLALPLNQLSGYKYEEQQTAANDDITTRDGGHSNRWTTYTRESPTVKSTIKNNNLRFLNPRNLKDTPASAFKEPKSAMKPGSSPLRYR